MPLIADISYVHLFLFDSDVDQWFTGGVLQGLAVAAWVQSVFEDLRFSRWQLFAFHIILGRRRHCVGSFFGLKHWINHKIVDFLDHNACLLAVGASRLVAVGRLDNYVYFFNVVAAAWGSGSWHNVLGRWLLHFRIICLKFVEWPF